MIDANSNSMQSRHDGQSWCLVVSGTDSGKARVEVSEDGHGYLPQGEISCNAGAISHCFKSRVWAAKHRYQVENPPQIRRTTDKGTVGYLEHYWSDSLDLGIK